MLRDTVPKTITNSPFAYPFYGDSIGGLPTGRSAIGGAVYQGSAAAQGMGNQQLSSLMNGSYEADSKIPEPVNYTPECDPNYAKKGCNCPQCRDYEVAKKSLPNIGKPQKGF